MQSDYLHIVGATEVAEGIMRGDQHALARGNGGELLARPGIEGVDALEPVLSVAPVVSGMGGVQLAHLRHQTLGGKAPQGGVHPDVRVGNVLLREQALAGDSACDGIHGTVLGQLLQYLGHLALEVQAVVQDEVGLPQAAQIPGGGLVQVWIDPRPHQGGDLHMHTADVLGHVGDHARGGGDLEGSQSLRAEGDQQEGEEVSENHFR